MAANTGRTTLKWTTLIIEDSGGVLRELPISTLSALGVVYDEVDLTAFQDVVRARLPAMPDAPIEWTGPMDTSAAAVVGTLSGSHTVLPAINGNTTARTLFIQVGVRHAWESGEPVFGAANGYILTKYDYDAASGMYSARAVCTGSVLPAWGTAALSA